MTRTSGIVRDGCTTRKESLVPTHTQEPEQATFVETALKLGGKSDDESQSETGALDRADEQVEAMFAKKYQNRRQPRASAPFGGQFFRLSCSSHRTRRLHRNARSDERFARSRAPSSSRRAKTLPHEQRKITDMVLRELGDVGYWVCWSIVSTAARPRRSFHSRDSATDGTVDPTVAGLARCMAARRGRSVRAFGSPAQKANTCQSWQRSASSAFALTEPCAGSDLTALKTEAKLEGDTTSSRREAVHHQRDRGRTIGPSA